MGSFSIWHWLVVLLVVLLLFGSGKISGLMGDMAKGIKAFRHNMKDDEKDAAMTADAAPPAATPPVGNLSGPAAAASQAATAQQSRPAA